MRGCSVFGARAQGGRAEWRHVPVSSPNEPAVCSCLTEPRKKPSVSLQEHIISNNYCWYLLCVSEVRRGEGAHKDSFDAG